MALFDLPLDQLRDYLPQIREHAAFDAFWRTTLDAATAVPPLLDVRPEPTDLALGRTWDVTLTPTVYQASPSTVSAKVLDGDVAYARLPEFAPGAADQVLRAIGDLHRGTPSLRAVILDLRLNPGGGVPEVAKLLGAFAHGQTWEYDCDTSGHCDEQRTDDTVPLLHLQLVVLTDRNCASACARSAAR